MDPSKRPNGRISLVDRCSSTLYSGMIPGVLGGIYSEKDASIDLRHLSDKAGVEFIQAEIQTLEWKYKTLRLNQQRSLNYQLLSLNIGCTSPTAEEFSKRMRCVPIKPLGPALKLIQEESSAIKQNNPTPFSVVGSGLAAIEVCLNLRKRWPDRSMKLVLRKSSSNRHFINALRHAGIQLISLDQLDDESPVLLCTGSVAPTLLRASGLICDSAGRVCTEPNLQVLGNSDLFASGDCAVINKQPRPPSGVWAVRAAPVLASNLEAASKGSPLLDWEPQRQALQLVGDSSTKGQPTAWALWGDLCLGPHPLIWKLKRKLDERFVAMLNSRTDMGNIDEQDMACRGCAAKLPAATLRQGLKGAGLATLGTEPNDAVQISSNMLQSVDGFPALVSDPWLNAYLTTLHASSDLWASGAEVDTAQALITLPAVDPALQKSLLTETLAGIRAALQQQHARLVGGHTLESRDSPPIPVSLGIQVNLIVNGQLPERQPAWRKGGFEEGDVLLLSRAIGNGVLFAAAMAGQADPRDLDQALACMQSSQHVLLQTLLDEEVKRPGSIHACTDITGFGLLGHLGEMLDTSEPGLQLCLNVDAIPSYKGALPLLKRGIHSSLAPSNREAWTRLDPQANAPASIELTSHRMSLQDQSSWQAMRELLVDPQTCGPLALACSKDLAQDLCRLGPWMRIGSVRRKANS